MTTDDRANEFLALFHQIYLRFHRRDRTGAYRMSQETQAVLRHLHDTGPLTVMEAARHFGRSQSSTSELIQRLVSRDLLARMADERDRRRTLIWLTEKGIDALAKAEQVLSVSLLSHAFEQLPPDRSDQITDALRELLATERHEPGVKDDE